MTNRQILNRENAGKTSISPERIVQFGAGNFLRAFTDWSIQELNEKADFDSSVVVVKVTPGTYASLDAQDGLFHVHLEGIENGEFVSRTQLISCISRTVYPYQDYASYRALARQEDIRFLISNTTEAGISYNEDDALDDAPPASFPAKLTQFLYERYQHFEGAADKGCIIIPTELVVDNGTQLKEMVLRYAEQWQLETAFSSWINEHNLFCNTLVDRIVPGYPEADSEKIQANIGFEDKQLVMGEPYYSWIIEAPDSLHSDLPVAGVLDGIKIVEDVEPYRLTKVRILNGIHSSMVSLGYLCGFRVVNEVMANEALTQLLLDEAYKEIIPSMELAEDELNAFAKAAFDRFRNPSIHHKLLSIALNSMTKVRTRILPTILAHYDKFDTLPERAVLAMAAFLRFYKGEWQGEAIPLKDDESVIAWLDEQWKNSDSVDSLVRAILQNESLWERDLTKIAGLQDMISDYIMRMDESGLLPIIEELNG